MRLSTKLGVIPAFALVGMVVLSVAAILTQRDEFRESAERRSAAVVDAAITIVSEYEAQARAGAISQDNARRTALAALKAIRYGEGDYVWVQDAAPRVIMHPLRPDLDGQFVGEVKDPAGFPLFRAFAAAAGRDGAGMVAYLWPKPGQSEPVEKVSYVRGFAPWGWIIGSGVYIDDLNAELRRKAVLFAIGTLLLGAAVFSTGFLLSRRIARPLAAMTGVMAELARGRLDTPVPFTERADELGEMAQAVRVFKDGLVRADALAGAERAEAERQLARASAVAELVAEFDQAAGRALDAVTAASASMAEAARAMKGTADFTSQTSTTVAAAAEEATANVQTVASAAEELAASVGEIERQVGHSAAIAGKAVADAAAARGSVDRLSGAALRIDEVVKLIGDIAAQTNLLALNATIEAARAGDAGRGFAVVASEVKTLSSQTARATEEIVQQIGAIRQEVAAVVAAIGQIGGTIETMSSVTATIASTVQQQSLAAREIAGSVEQAAAGTGDVSSNIVKVKDAAGDTGRSADGVERAAAAVDAQCRALRSTVERFLGGIKAA